MKIWSTKGELNFQSYRTSQDKLNFGDEDLNNLAIYSMDFPYPCERYTKVIFEVKAKDYLPNKNLARYFRLNFYKDDKSIYKAMTGFIKEGVKELTTFLIVDPKKAEGYNKLKLELLVEKYDDDGLGLESFEVYLGEKDV